jgi:hypothetical protein
VGPPGPERRLNECIVITIETIAMPKERMGMDISKLLDAELKHLHDAIVSRKAEEFAVPVEDQVYGVRKYPDWKEQADAFEAEMTKRGIAFRQIRWD